MKLYSEFYLFLSISKFMHLIYFIIHSYIYLFFFLHKLIYHFICLVVNHPTTYHSKYWEILWFNIKLFFTIIISKSLIIIIRHQHFFMPMFSYFPLSFSNNFYQRLFSVCNHVQIIFHISWCSLLIKAWRFWYTLM